MRWHDSDVTWTHIAGIKTRIPIEMSTLSARLIVKTAVELQGVSLKRIGKILVRRNGTVEFIERQKKKPAI